MPTFIQDATPHVLAFPEILLVERGRGRVFLDGEVAAVARGTVVITLTGQVREWRLAERLDGPCLFFTEEFVAEVFSDPRFLDQFAYFRTPRPSPTVHLAPAERRRFADRFAAMRREIALLDADATPALRALLYELLVLLNRWYRARHRAPAPAPPSALVERFVALVGRDHARRHRVADYAAELGVTPGHLGALCRAHRRQSAGAIIRARLALEARRLLLYGDLTAAEVADRLGFEDPSYFARFFRREVGTAPSRFRVSRGTSGTAS